MNKAFKIARSLLEALATETKVQQLGEAESVVLSALDIELGD